MSANQPTVRPEELLAHQGFLAGLVHSLVFDHEEAEDYLQETWAYALKKPPRRGPGLPAWLATVARNFIRQDRRARGRRDLREAARAVPEADTGTEKAVERECLRRRVVDAVLELDEPYRTAVVLRYLDDLPPREIAKRTGAPVETVRTRIKRALKMLRTRFDDEHDGDRRAWCMALVPLLADQQKAAAAAAGAGLIGGILLMSTRTKVTIAAALIAVLLGMVYLLAPPGAADVARPVPPPSERAPTGVAEAPSAPDPVPEPAAPEAEEAAEGRVDVKFRDTDGRAISVEEVVRRYADAGIPLAVRAVPEALFTGNSIPDMLRMRVKPPDEWARAVPLEVGPESVRLAEAPEPGRYRLFLGRPGAAPMVTEPFEVPAGEEVGVDVHLPLEAETVPVRLVEDETGAPLAGATVTPLFEYGDDHMFLPGPPLVSDSQGHVSLPLLSAQDLGHHRQPSWWARTENRLGLIPHWELSRNPPGEEMEVRVPRSAVVAGTAWLSNGEPAAGKEIAWFGKGLTTVTTVLDDGTFRIDPVAVWDDRGAEIILVEDLETVRLKQTRAPIAAGETTEITIGEPAGSRSYATITGRVTIGGRPVSDAFVVTRTEGEGGNKGFVRTAADGTYRKEDVQPGRVHVSVWFGDPRTVDDFHARRLEPLEVSSGEVHRFDFELPTGAFRVTVVDDETGKPIPGAVALAGPTDPEAGRDRFPGFHYVPGWGLRTGSDGSCVLLAMLPGEEHTVRATADGYAKAASAGHLPGTQDRPAEVTIRLKRE